MRTREDILAEINESAQEYSTKFKIDFQIARICICVGYEMGVTAGREIINEKIDELNKEAAPDSDAAP